MAEKKKKHVPFSTYPTDDLIERGNKIITSNLPENIAVWIIILGFIAVALGIAIWMG